MAAGPTALHALGDTFRRLAEAATGGAVEIRVFPSGTLGQEREVVQQLQEGLVDFMVSGTAIWGSVAPKLRSCRSRTDVVIGSPPPSSVSLRPPIS